MNPVNMTPRKPNCSRKLHVFVFVLFQVAAAAALLAASGLTNETDYQSLLAFKGQIASDPSDALGSWNDSINFCGWDGVTCGKKHRRVTELRLPSLRLFGPLSPHIWNLTFLRVLNLEGNHFNGILPQEIGRLSRLEVLRLSNNSLGGELPGNLTSFADLRILSLGGNIFQGRILDKLGTLTNLTNLSLSLNQFTGEIPSSLGNLSALTQLSLAENHFRESIPPELGHLSNLEFLLLGGNNLSGDIPAPLYNISSIIIFAVEQNNLRGSLPSNLFLDFPELQGLYLAINQFSGLIPSSITNASRVVTMDFSTNAFGGPIPKDLRGLGSLQKLNFEINNLGTEGGDDFSFLGSLINCTALDALSAGDNRLRGIMPDSVANLSSALTKLLLDRNFMSGTIPSGIQNLLNLQLLTLGENMLSGRIPSSIGKFPKLQILHLGQNNLSGPIPSSLGNVTWLSLLYFAQNMLDGTIPASLGNCTRLNMLSLEDNLLVGEVPQELFGLSSLTAGLSLAGNYLTGRMPSRVGKLVNLQILNVSANNLVGEIPTSIGDCAVLEYLYLQGNQFCGTIPPSISGLRGLKSLDLSRNNLSGQIPGFLADLPFIEHLNFSFNMFEGEVPSRGIFSNLSAVSVVGNYKLCGGPPTLQLPKCKGATSSHRTVIVIVTVTISVFALLVGFVAIIIYRSKKLKTGTGDASSNESHHLPKLSYGELSRATNEFSLANIIGEGSFGMVYKGVLPRSGQVVAVKVLKLGERGAAKSFMAECETLRNIRHRNLVKMITACSTLDHRRDDFKALVFEFMPNGSLEKWLHPIPDKMGDIEPETRLSLDKRLNIAVDVAAALDYLHNHCHIPIAHSDLKPSNVLLDSDFTAHVSDFGLAKFLVPKATGTESSSIAIKGTFGYVAPEYGLGGKVSARGDMYSFGILLLELFTGKRPTDPMFGGEFGLREFVQRCIPDGMNEAVDPSSLCRGELSGDVEQCVLSVLKLGLMSSAAEPSKRMDIGEAAAALQKARDVFFEFAGGKTEEKSD